MGEAAKAKARPPPLPPSSRASSRSPRRAWPPWSTRRAPGTASRRPTACPGSGKKEQMEEVEKTGEEEKTPRSSNKRSNSACASRRPRRRSACPAPGPCRACPAWPRSRPFWRRETGFHEKSESEEKEFEVKFFVSVCVLLLFLFFCNEMKMKKKGRFPQCVSPKSVEGIRTALSEEEEKDGRRRTVLQKSVGGRSFSFFLLFLLDQKGKCVCFNSLSLSVFVSLCV